MKTLVIGSGYKNKEIEGEVITLDYFSTNPNIDVIHNLDKFPYPFKNNEFDVIYAEAVLEHLENLWWREKGDDNVLDELHRILKPNGILHAIVPHPSCCLNFAHPTHIRYFPTNAFFNVTKNAPEKYSEKEYKILKRELIYENLYWFGKFITWLANRSEFTQKLFERYLVYYIGGFNLTYFKLQAAGN